MARLAAPLTVFAQADEPLDALVFRFLQKGAGAVEAVLAANPNLADFGSHLPAGTPVVLPVAASAPVEQPLIQLWT